MPIGDADSAMLRACVVLRVYMDCSVLAKIVVITVANGSKLTRRGPTKSNRR